MNAEMLVGAAGWASGSQTCSGMTPALTPNPTRKSAKSPSRRGPGAMWPDNSASNDREPGPAASARKPAIKQPVPTCDITRYRYAARRLVRSSCSVATRAAVASVISSHANRNAIASPAVNTSSTAPTSALNAAPMKADRRLKCGCPTYPML